MIQLKMDTVNLKWNVHSRKLSRRILKKKRDKFVSEIKESASSERTRNIKRYLLYYVQYLDNKLETKKRI